MKRYTLFTLLLLAVNTLAGTTFEFQNTGDDSQTKDGISMVITQGSGQNAPKETTDYETQKYEMRLFAGNKITLSSQTEFKHVQLVFAKSSASNKAYTGLSANVGDLTSGGESTSKTDWKIDIWEGEATELIFTLTGSGQRRIKTIVVDGDPVEIEEDAALPTMYDLDWSYEYSDPTLVQVPDTQLFAKEYAFITNNILVHCSKGSIVFASEEEDAYFGCQMNETLTFTATMPIKGIAINGNVRKNFKATADIGDISYWSDEDMEIADDPVLVVRDIDDYSVAIHCEKNLSCYAVRIYFESNPDPVGTETAINETEHSKTQVQKILRNGQTLIIVDNNTFTITGEQL